MSLLLLEVKKVDFENHGFPKGTENGACVGVPRSLPLGLHAGLTAYFLLCPLYSETQEQHAIVQPSLLSCTRSCPFLQMLFIQAQQNYMLL